MEGRAAITKRSTILAKLAGELARGCEVIRAIDDAAYTTPSPRTGSVGAQFRHNLDVAAALARGLESGEIDYGGRQRDPMMEIDRGYAVGRFASLIARLTNLAGVERPGLLRVRSEGDSRIWYASSVDREADYVYAHTVHHHALIGEKLATFGISVDPEFGVATSTLEYRKTTKLAN